MDSNTIIIGRSMDSYGKPLLHTGVKIHKGSKTNQLLSSQNTVIISNPVTKEYGALLNFTNADGKQISKGLGIIPPGSLGPPKHIHPQYDETFTVIEGSFLFFLNNKTSTVKEGETLTVKKGTAHTFKPADNSKVSAFILEANPPGKLNEVIRTIWGLAHDGKTKPNGQPSEFLQGIAIGCELEQDTLFVSPPPFIQKTFFKLFGKMAAKKGFKGIYEKYTSDDFWMSRVEQFNS